MKNTMCLALIILAVLPASAQKAAVSKCQEKGDEATALAQDYSAHVDGLLRDVHAALQKISAGVEAGTLSPELARDLKLAATREMISRLDAFSAVYDALLEKEKEVHAQAALDRNASAGAKAMHGTPDSNTVTVEELEAEAARQAREIGR